MPDVKNKTVNIYIDQTSALAALDSLQKKADKLTISIDAGRAAGKNMNAEIKKLSETQEAIKNVQVQIDNGLKPTFLQVQNQVTKLRNELKRMSEDSPEYAEKFNAYLQASSGLDEMQKKIRGVIAAEQELAAKNVALKIVDPNLGPSLEAQKLIVEDLNKELALLPSHTQAFADKLNELKSQEVILDQLRDKIKGINQPVVIDGAAGATLEQQELIVKSLNDELKKLSPSTQEFTDKLEQLKKEETTLDTIKDKIKGINQPIVIDIANGATLEQQEKIVAGLNAELRQLPNNTVEFDNKLKDLRKEEVVLQEIKDKIKDVNQPIVIDVKSGPTFQQQKKIVSDLNTDLEKLPVNTDAFSKKLDELRKQEGILTELKEKINGVEVAQRSWMDEAKTVAFGVLIGNTVQSALAAIGGYFSGIINGNAKMSDSLAEARGTTHLTAEEIKNLGTQLKTIDTRTTQEELLKIVEIGGQFNVPKEQLKGFVEQMDRAKVVLGSEFGGGAEQITTELALLRNVFTDIKSEHIDTDLGHIGNTLVTLAQEGAATAPVISDFSKRLSPLISTAKLTSGEILGLGASLQELAVNPERGGTAVVKLFDKMISNAEAFAKVAGVGVEDFKKKLQTDSFGAFLQVLEGFKKGGDNVIALNSTVQELETSGVGAKEVLVKLSDNIDLVKGRSDLATQSLTKQTAITEQFTIKNNTLGAETDKLSKKLGYLIQSKTLTEFFANSIHVIIGFIDVIKAVPAFIKNNETAIALLIIGLATMNATYIKAAVLITRDTALRLYNAVVTRGSAIATNLAIAAQAAYIQITRALTGQITIATAAQRLWNIAMSLGAGPIGAIIIAAGALVLIIGNLVGAFKTASAEQKLFGEIQAKAADDVSSQKAGLDTLTNAVNNNSLSLEDRKKALSGLIAINPAYLSGLTLENIRTSEGKKIIDDYVLSLDRMAKAKATQALKEDLYKKQVEASVKAQEASAKAPTSAIGLGLQTAMITTGVGAFTGLQEAFSAREDVKKSQDDIDALNVVTQKQITEENKLIDAQQQKMKGLKADTVEYKNEQVKLNDLIATRNVLMGLEATTLKTGNTSLNNDLKTTEGIIDQLKAKIKLLDDALGGLKTKPEITDNRAERQKLQDQLDALEGKGREKKAKAEENAREKLLKELSDFQFELQQVGKQADESEIARITKKYDDLIKKAADYGINYINLEKEKNRAIAYLIDQEQQKRDEAIRKMNQAASEETYKNFQDAAVTEGEGKKDVVQKQYGDGVINKRELAEQIKRIDIETYNFEVGIANSFVGVSKQASIDLVNLKKRQNKLEIDDAVTTREHLIELQKREALAAAQVQVLKTPDGTKARLSAQLNLLSVEHDNELKNTELTNSEKEKLNLEYQNKVGQTTVQFYAQQVEQTIGFIQSGLSIISKFGDAATARENAAFAKEQKQNDAKKAAIQKLEQYKVISSQESQRRITQIQIEEDAKKAALEKKQGERQKKIAIAQAIMNGALAVTATLAAVPGPLDLLTLTTARYIAIGLAIATTAAEVATISSTKYGKGGKLTGPSHSDGGMPVINPVTGVKEAEVEGGEYILSKSTVANNRDLADALLYTSMNQGGRSIKPSFGKGGVLPGPSEDEETPSFGIGGILPEAKKEKKRLFGKGGLFDFGKKEEKLQMPSFGNGGQFTIKPFWEKRPYKSIDYPTVTTSMQKVKYGTGGVFQATNTPVAAAQPSTDPILADLLSQQQNVTSAVADAVSNLNAQLANGIGATVSLKQLEDTQAQRDRIKKAASFK